MSDVHKIRIKDLFSTAPIGQLVEVQGWVRTKRTGKRIIFITVNDGSSLQNLQIVIAHTQLPEDMMQHIIPGSSLQVQGVVSLSKGQAQHVELQGEQILVLGDAAHYPIQPKPHSLDFLRQLPHLRFRTRTFHAIFRIRHVVSYAIHQFFHEKGFTYLHTPLITGIDAEGAGAVFNVTTLNHTTSTKPSNHEKFDFSQDFFKQKTHLTVSGQLGAEAAVFGLREVYTFGPTFRAENSNTTRHLAEFWMVEPEMAFYNLQDTIKLAVALLKYVIQYVLTTCTEEINALQKSTHKKHLANEPSLHDKLTHTVQQDFACITYTQAWEILQSAPVTLESPIRAWGVDLQAVHERYLTEQHFRRPVIITDYPSKIKAFYMRQNEDGKTVAAMDILCPGIGELIGGSQREERLALLLDRMQQMNIDPDTLAWYLDTRKFGTVPHSGFGLGLERLVQFITGMENIRDVIPFPRTPGHAQC